MKRINNEWFDCRKVLVRFEKAAQKVGTSDLTDNPIGVCSGRPQIKYARALFAKGVQYALEAGKRCVEKN